MYKEYSHHTIFNLQHKLVNIAATDLAVAELSTLSSQSFDFDIH